MGFTVGFSGIIPAQDNNAFRLTIYSLMTGTVRTFAQQYLPELYEAEVERYGNRTLSGFLRMVGAEMPMTSDQVIWSEQNRLHVAYDDVDLAVTTGDLLYKLLLVLIKSNCCLE